MNRLFGIALIAAAGYAGYRFEPQLRPAILSTSNSAAPVVIEEEVEEDAPAKPKHAAPKIDLASIQQGEFPDSVKLREEVTVTDATGQSMILPAGNKVKPVRLDDDKLVVSPAGTSYEGKIAPAATDFLEQVDLRRKSGAPITPPTPEPVTPTPVTPEPTPAEPTPVTPEPTPAEPTPVEPVKPEEPAVVDSNSASSDVVKLMQASLKNGQISEFKFEQVIGWKDAGTETIGGQSYHIGLAAYKAETIFGPNTLQAKALIQNGKVVKWVFVKSGLEMK